MCDFTQVLHGYLLHSVCRYFYNIEKYLLLGNLCDFSKRSTAKGQFEWRECALRVRLTFDGQQFVQLEPLIERSRRGVIGDWLSDWPNDRMTDGMIDVQPRLSHKLHSFKVRRILKSITAQSTNATASKTSQHTHTHITIWLSLHSYTTTHTHTHALTTPYIGTHRHTATNTLLSA